MASLKLLWKTAGSQHQNSKNSRAGVLNSCVNRNCQVLKSQNQLKRLWVKKVFVRKRNKHPAVQAQPIHQLDPSRYARAPGATSLACSAQTAQLPPKGTPSVFQLAALRGGAKEWVSYDLSNVAARPPAGCFPQSETRSSGSSLGLKRWNVRHKSDSASVFQCLQYWLECDSHVAAPSWSPWSLLHSCGLGRTRTGSVHPTSHSASAGVVLAVLIHLQRVASFPHVHIQAKMQGTSPFPQGHKSVTTAPGSKERFCGCDQLNRISRAAHMYLLWRRGTKSLISASFWMYSWLCKFNSMAFIGFCHLYPLDQHQATINHMISFHGSEDPLSWASAWTAHAVKIYHDVSVAVDVGFWSALCPIWDLDLRCVEMILALLYFIVSCLRVVVVLRSFRRIVCASRS